MLSNVVRGCTSFKEIRTFNGEVHMTYKEASYAQGLLGNDNEWNDCLHEAAVWASPAQLRQLFVIMLLNCNITDPRKLWHKNSEFLSEDVEYMERKILKCSKLKFNPEQKENYAVAEIEELLKRNGKTLSDIEGMPRPNKNLHETV